MVRFRSFRVGWFVASASVCGVLCCAMAGAQSGAAAGRTEGAASAELPAGPVAGEAVLKQINTGHPQEALATLDGMAGKVGAPVWVDRDRGLALYAMGRLAEADGAFQKALERDPKDAEAAQMRGLTLFRLGQPAKAIPLLEGSHAWGPQMKADPTYVLALCYVDTRRYDDARRAFAAQYGFAPESAAAYVLAARMLLRRDYLPVAKEFATKALQLDAGMPLAHSLLGEIALAGNHLDEAVAEFEQERTRNPLDGAVYERLGDAYARGAKYGEAQRVLQQAVLLEPNATGPYILLGKVMLKREDPAAAATFLQKAETMDPANFMTHSLLAQADRALGRQAEAARELEVAQKIQAADEPKLSTLK